MNLLPPPSVLRAARRAEQTPDALPGGEAVWLDAGAQGLLGTYASAAAGEGHPERPVRFEPGPGHRTPQAGR